MPPREHSTWYPVLATILVLGLLALTVHLIFGERGYLALREKQREYERLRQEVEALQEENRRLEEEIKALRSDPRAIERVAREELKMVRPGEKVYGLPQNSEAKPPPRKSPKKP